jgi:hypothetical protein
MSKLADRIDPVHSRAICAEIAERLRISLPKDQAPLPTLLEHRLADLRLAEEQSPSIVPSINDEVSNRGDGSWERSSGQLP